jgi:hypothetical protein
MELPLVYVTGAIPGFVSQGKVRGLRDGGTCANESQ